jgi:hypothetical protein
MTQPFSIVVDSFAPAKLARFWADALPGYRVRPYDDAEIARLASAGLTPETDTSVPIDGPAPTIWFQKSADVTNARNRIHFDLTAERRATEVERLAQLGARIRDECETHVVMLDPEGNQFCVFGP